MITNERNVLYDSVSSSDLSDDVSKLSRFRFSLRMYSVRPSATMVEILRSINSRCSKWVLRTRTFVVEKLKGSVSYMGVLEPGVLEPGVLESGVTI